MNTRIPLVILCLLVSHCRDSCAESASTITFATVKSLIVSKNVDALAKILDEDKSLISIKDTQKNSLMHVAARVKGFQIAEVLADRGAEIDLKNSGGLTPLHLAILSGNNEAAVFLANRGASVDIFSAAGFGNLQKLRDFDTKNPKVFNKELSGLTLFQWAGLSKSVETVDWMLHNGADVNIAGEKGVNAITLAVKNDDLPLLRASNIIPFASAGNKSPRTRG